MGTSVRKTGRGFALAILTFALTLSSVAIAKDENGPGLTIEQAAAKVQKETGGRVLGAETTQDDGGTMYRIKVLHDGRVSTILVDPRSGSIQK